MIPKVPIKTASTDTELLCQHQHTNVVEPTARDGTGRGVQPGIPAKTLLIGRRATTVITFSHT